MIKLKIDLVKLCEREIEKNENFGVKPSDLDEESQLLNIDITLDEPKSKGDKQLHLGIKCCNYIKKTIEDYPKMKILALVFKKFLSLKNLNKPYMGGLSSYSLVQMILALLKHQEEQFQKIKYLESI